MRTSTLTMLFALLLTAPLAAQLYVQDGGSLTLSDEGSFLYTNGLSIEAGGTLTLLGTLEWENHALNQGTIVFQISDLPPTEKFGRLISPQGDDIEFHDDRIITELVGGFTPEGVLSYPIITAGSLDQLPATQELPGPLWSYRFTDAEVFAEFDADALPVEWLGFTGRWRGTAVRLDWQTATEVNSDRFVVQRQDPHGHWRAIGSVAAAGNSGTPKSYDFLDPAPGPTDPVLYRLQQVDHDGSFAYSSILSLARGTSPTAVRLYPNPARDHLYMEGLGAGTFTITDALGRAVARGTLRQSTLRIRVELPAGLAPGTYFLHPRTGNTLRFSLLP